MNIADTTFKLTDTFIGKYANQQPNWGPIGYITYRRSYSRPLNAVSKRIQNLAKKYHLDTSEEFWLTLVRVVEGTYRIQEAHCKSLKLPWNTKKAQKSAQEMYELMWNFKFLPPGRGLWAMGTDAVFHKGAAILNNCGFASTKNLQYAFSEPFCFLMDFSMLGVGIGGDTKGAGKVYIKQPRTTTEPHVVEDSREGWVEIVRRILDSYVGSDTLPINIDYSKVRKAGEPIRGFGGIASGPEPLKELVEDIQKVLNPLIEDTITSTAIVDLFNLIGRCVVAGGIRRTAEIMFGEVEDEEYIDLKNPELHAEALAHHRWCSNNSILATEGMNYAEVAKRTAKNGEPGYFWLENARAYSRIKGLPDWKDEAATGANPCQPAWATVLTPQGISTIGQVKIGDLIWGGHSWTKVTNKWSTGKKPVYGYYTERGAFYGTENHRIISHGEKIEVWKASSIDISPCLPDCLEPEQRSFPILYSEYVSTEEVFDLTVEDSDHTYWTGGLLVSNCLEQTLENTELCCLVETFPANHETYEEFERTLKFAYLYAKTVTLIPTHNEKTNAITMRNRRIGTSQSGIIQAFNKHGRRTTLNWCDKGYDYIRKVDKIYSKWLCIPESIKVTSIKPSGTVSLLPGATPGIHFPHSEYYYRVIRFAQNNPLVQKLKEAGYRCIDLDQNKESNTTVVYFPIHEQHFQRGKFEVSMWEQLEIAAQYQTYWADNQVSVTISFKPEEANDIQYALELYETRLKGVSFLPILDHKYEHAPYQAITRQEYEQYVAEIKELDLSKILNDQIETGCDGEKCILPAVT